METNLNNISVLLVNDNTEKTRIVREAIVLIGITNVKVVRNYNEALDVLKKISFNMILVEQHIENSPITSHQFILMLRKDVENFAHVCDIPVIIMAAAVSKQEVEAARDVGVNEFVTYPFSVAYLTKVVTSILEAPRKFIVSKSFFGPDRRRTNRAAPENKERRKDEDR